MKNRLCVYLALLVFIASFGMPATASSLRKKETKKSCLKITETKWEITCPGKSNFCFTWAKSDDMEMTEPGGPAKRKQVQVFQNTADVSGIVTTGIFLHTDPLNRDAGIGYYPAGVTVYQQAGAANVIATDNTNLYDNLEDWRSAKK